MKQRLWDLDKQANMNCGGCSASLQMMTRALFDGNHELALRHARSLKEDAARVEAACEQLIKEKGWNDGNRTREV